MMARTMREAAGLAAAITAGAVLTAAGSRRRAKAPAGPDEVTLAEYKQIKGEQDSRIKTRDNLLYAVIVATGAVLAGSHSPREWLLVPVVAFILGWNYLVNDSMISFIGRYFREHPGLPGLRWEHDHHTDRRMAERKLIQLFADLITFPGTGSGFLVAFWLEPGPQPVLLLAASAAEAAAMLLLAWQFILYSAPFRRRR